MGYKILYNYGPIPNYEILDILGNELFYNDLKQYAVFPTNTSILDVQREYFFIEGSRLFDINNKMKITVWINKIEKLEHMYPATYSARMIVKLSAMKHIDQQIKEQETDNEEDDEEEEPTFEGINQGIF